MDKNPYWHGGRAVKDTYRHDGCAYSLSRKFAAKNYPSFTPAQDSLSVSSMEIKHIQVCLREAITEADDDDWNNPFYKYFVLW